MKKAIIAAAAYFFIVSAGIAAAQTSPNYWRVNSASSTITPANTSLQVPCANVVGGCASGGQSLGTTSTPTFAGVTVSGNVTSTSFDTTSAVTSSFSAYFNNLYTLPTASQLTAGANCGGFTDHDAGNCINDIYSVIANSTSGISIVVPPNQAYTYATGFAATGTGRIAISCGEGSSDIFTYNGPTSTPAVDVDTQSYNNTLYDHTPGSEIDNCLFFTTNSATTTPGMETTGIFVGGSNVTPHVRLNNVNIHGFSICLNTGSNVYDFEDTNIVETKCGTTWLINSFNNSGEGFKSYNPFWADPANNSSTNCIVISNSAVASFEVYGGSADNCGYNIDVGNTNVAIYGQHNEDPDWQFIPDYYRYVIAGGGATTVDIYGGTFQIDSQTSTASVIGLVNDGGYFYADGVSLANSPSSTQRTTFVTNVISPGTSRETVCYTAQYGTPAPVTSLINAADPITPAMGCFSSWHNSYISGTDNEQANSAWNLIQGNSVPIDVQVINGGGSGGGVAIDLGGAGVISTTTGTTASSSVFIDGTLGLRNIVGGTTTIAGPEIGTTNGRTVYIFNGTGVGTDTLPLIASTTQRIYFFDNRGSASLFIAPTSTDLIQGMATGTSYSIGAGNSAAFYNDGIVWDVLIPSGSICKTYIDRVTGNTDYTYASSTALVVTASKPSFCQ